MLTKEQTKIALKYASRLDLLDQAARQPGQPLNFLCMKCAHTLIRHCSTSAVFKCVPCQKNFSAKALYRDTKKELANLKAFSAAITSVIESQKEQSPSPSSVTKHPEIINNQSVPDLYELITEDELAEACDQTQATSRQQTNQTIQQNDNDQKNTNIDLTLLKNIDQIIAVNPTGEYSQILDKWHNP